jgi:histidyl-tRNA synthetase
LTSADVRARVSDRRLLRAILASLGVDDGKAPSVFAVVDKFQRQPRDVSREKLVEAGVSAASIDALFALLGDVTLDDIARQFGDNARHCGVARRLSPLLRVPRRIGLSETG